MTLKRLVTTLGILIVLAGVGIMCLWQYAYSPQGRARTIIVQLKGDTISPLAWMISHHVVRPAYSASWAKSEGSVAEVEMMKLGHEALPVVIEAMQDENRVVRTMAVRVCRTFRDPVAIQSLAECMCDEGGDFVLQHLCLVSLVEIGPEAYGSLCEAARKANPDVRWMVPKTVAQTWGAKAVPQLIGFLDDSDLYIRWSAASELARFKDKRATESLIRHLSDSDAMVAKSSAIALGDIGDPKAIPALLKTFKDTHVENRVRIPAAGALARMGRDDGLNYLLVMIKSPQILERAEAAGELGTNRIKGTFEPLLPLLGDSDTTVRRSALWALGEVRDPIAIPAIRKFLNDPDSDIRIAADDALKKFEGKPTALQPGKS